MNQISLLNPLVFAVAYLEYEDTPWHGRALLYEEYVFDAAIGGQ